MQVETFECQETAAEPLEATEEAVALMQSLGLDGQLSLVNPVKSEGDFATRCPYRQITQEESFVYRTLCPTVYDLEKYDAAPIPLRVLQIAAHAKSIIPLKPGETIKLKVWDKTKAEIKDPVLIAEINDAKYIWQVARRFILARWGEVLEAFAVLLAKAVPARRAQLLDEHQQALAKIERMTDAEIVMGLVS